MPLERLPLDVLKLIFEQAARDARRPISDPVDEATLFANLEREIHLPLVLRAVSRLLYSVAELTPMLWTTVADFMPPQLCQLFLTCSRVLPLTVVVESMFENPEPVQEAFLRAVLQHRQRWRSFFIGLPDGYVGPERFPDCADWDFPSLTMAVVIGEQRRGDRTAIILDQNLFLSQWAAPSLSSAMFCNAMPHGPILDSLTTLHINLHDPCLNPPRLWAPLVRCSSLRALRIICDHCVRLPNEDFDPEDATDDIVSLESVRTFTLIFEQMLLRDAEWIFNAFEFPRLRRLFIAVHDPEDEPDGNEWADALLLSGGFGCGESLKHFAFQFTQRQGGTHPGSPALFDLLFCQSAFPALRQLELSFDTFCSHPMSAATGIPTFAYFPSSLAVIDIVDIPMVAQAAFIELLDRLCEVGSRATVYVCEQALWNETDLNEVVVASVKDYCRRARRARQMAFDIQWVESEDEVTVVAEHSML